MSNIGRIIHGYCNGYFGRDSYGSKRIEGEGHDWIVARGLDKDAETEFASIEPERKEELIAEWAGVEGTM